MKKLMIASVMGLVVLTNINSFAHNGTELTGNSIVPEKKVEEPFYIQEEVGQFPGGEVAFEKFIQKSIQYPAIAKAQGIEGKVVVALVIDETGAVNNVEVIQGIGGGCEEEVIRVLSAMPNWAPTKQAGHQVKMKRIFSFNFTL
jgi:protein TonB